MLHCWLVLRSRHLLFVTAVGPRLYDHLNHSVNRINRQPSQSKERRGLLPIQVLRSILATA